MATATTVTASMAVTSRISTTTTFIAYGGPECYYVKKWHRGYKRVIKVCDRSYF